MSKVVKKFTKPVSKVLDKIVPNEIKPALPYLAAFAPYLLPGGGIFASAAMRGLASAGANLTSQLAQEGSEGDFNALSLALAGGQGYLSAPGDSARGIKSGSETLRGYKNPGVAATGTPGVAGQEFSNVLSNANTGAFDTSGLSYLDNVKNFALEGGANLADKIGGARDTLGNAIKMNPNSANLEIIGKAATAPIALGTGDLAYAQGQRATKDFNRAEAAQSVEDEMRRRGMDQEYIDSITESMTAYGYSQADIDEIIQLQGYEGNANGGRIGYDMGGRVGYGMGGDIMQGIMGMIGGGEKKPDFNTMAETVETVEMEPKEYLFDNKLKFTVNPGDNEMQSVLNALFQDTAGIIPEDRKQEYYDLYIPQLYRSGDISRNEYEGYIEEGILSNNKSMGGSVLPKNMDMENLMAYEPGVPTTGDLYDMNNPDYKDINPKVIREFIEEGIPLGYTSPEEYFDDFYGPFAKKEKNTMTAKDGGIMNNYNMGGSVLPQGMEMDYRQGGMIPMGSAERADDVPARVSKNEFVMTADAVRAAGGGSVNQGAKKMYKLMNNLEARA